MNISRKIMISILGISILSILIFAGATILLDEHAQDTSDQSNDANNTITGTVVATVNGEEITFDDVTSIQQSYMQQGQQLLEEEAIEQLIDQKILIQEAQQQGFMQTDEEAESTIETILLEQNSTLEEYKQQLKQQGLSYEEQLQEYKNQAAIQNYLNDVFKNENFSVTDEEAINYYEIYQQQSEQEVPPYEDLESQIKDYLRQQKQQEAINALVQELREDADIKHY
jgi:parvulin-like peptidyl-prolyl isomerase